MSGIYIKGMEMPDRCEACLFFVKNIHDRGDDSLCLALGGEAKLGCPLMERFSYSPGDTAEDRIWIRAARRIIIEAPTIIPADEEVET